MLKPLNLKYPNRIGVITHKQHCSKITTLPDFKVLNYPMKTSNVFENDKVLVIFGRFIFPVENYYEKVLYFLDNEGNFIHHKYFDFLFDAEELKHYKRQELYETYKKKVFNYIVDEYVIQAIGRIRPSDNSKRKFVVLFGQVPIKLKSKHSVYERSKFEPEFLLKLILKLDNPNLFEVKDTENFYFFKENQLDIEILRQKIFGNYCLDSLIANKYKSEKGISYNKKTIFEKCGLNSSNGVYLKISKREFMQLIGGKFNF